MATRQDDKIGALWTRATRDNAEYLKGEITVNGVKTEIVVFRNGYKQTDKHPSHIIYLSTPRHGAPAAPSDDDAPREPEPWPGR